MENLKLEKFADAKLENLQMIAGGACWTTLDGVEKGDCVDNQGYFLVRDSNGDMGLGNPDTTDGACL